MSHLRRSEEERTRIDDEAPCIVTKDSPNKNAVPLDRCKATTAFWGSFQAEAWKGHTAFSIVLHIEEKVVTPDSLALEEFLQARRGSRFCQERSK